MIVGTPGRVVDHLSNTKGFSLKALKHLVLDEADKLLDMDFEQEIDQILKVGFGVVKEKGGLYVGVCERGRRGRGGGDRSNATTGLLHAIFSASSGCHSIVHPVS